ATGNANGPGGPFTVIGPMNIFPPLVCKVAVEPCNVICVGADERPPSPIPYPDVASLTIDELSSKFIEFANRAIGKNANGCPAYAPFLPADGRLPKQSAHPPCTFIITLGARVIEPGAPAFAFMKSNPTDVRFTVKDVLKVVLVEASPMKTPG